jgi:peptidyl-tRNA hydrolase, PTH1 family
VWLVVGLGNPGPQYENTRHNVGFQIIDTIAERSGAGTPREKWGASVVETRLGDERVLLCKPMEFMNLSGQAVTRVAQFWKIDPARAVVVHDDLDLPLGRLKLGAGGGHGGHNGVRSILAEWGRADFARVRCGIGRPVAGKSGSGYVLGAFAKDEHDLWRATRLQAADATEAVVKLGLTVAMNRFNVKTGQNPAKDPAPG